ncbi:hypothetical protein BGZ72_010819 [Mortierella alpina]|nr:hypothetical protein BGZ72_010819 [Mortierella alpina]
MADSDTLGPNLRDIIIHGGPISLDKLSLLEEDLGEKREVGTSLNFDLEVSSIRESKIKPQAAEAETAIISPPPISRKLYFKANEREENDCEYVCSEE